MDYVLMSFQRPVMTPLGQVIPDSFGIIICCGKGDTNGIIGCCAH